MRTHRLPRARRLPLAAAAILTSIAASPSGAVEVLIPSYFYPGGPNNAWPQLNAAAGRVGVTAILNPGSGPGATLDPNYRSAANALRASGGRVIGYVSTAYADRPIADVKADIATYRALYPLDGIFLDEVTNGTAATSLAYYAEVYRYIKSIDADWRVTGNPGTNVASAYLATPVADTLVTFESNAGYLASSPSSYTGAYAARRFSALPYAVGTAASMVTHVNAAVAKRAGYVYVTDDGPDGNPWDRLPAYWSAELDAIRAVTPTWVADASGDWHRAGAWTTSAAPDGVGAEAMLLGAIATPQTVFTNADVTLGTLAFNNASRYVVTGAGTLTLDAAVESALVDVRRGHHTVNLPLTLRDPTIADVAAGASLTIADPLTVLAGASLTKRGAGTLSITSTVTGGAVAVTAGVVAIEGDASFAALTVAPGATVDLADGATLSITAASVDPLRAMLADARAGGDWSGTGLTSDGADALHGIGYGVESDGSLRVRVAQNGDADLDGDVDLADLRALATHYDRTSAATWADGDFDYDGVANAADRSLLAANYDDATRFDADWALVASLVPEPAVLVALALLGPALARRRPSSSPSAHAFR